MTTASLILTALLLSVPGILTATGWRAGNVPVRYRSRARVESQAWSAAFRGITATGVLLAGIVACVWLGGGRGPEGWLSAEPLRLIMLGLIVFMGLVLVRFSRHYMAGEARYRHYLRWLLLTLAAVTVVVLSDHLLLLLAGWVAISLALHQLLMFYPHRPRAALAAHKKFILARLAELSLLAAFALLWYQHQTGSISGILAAYTAEARAPTAIDQAAAVLIALTALIKSAQLPLHGWLIQVVEAPTPVSALLHAGVINLGGFLLILFAPLFSEVAAARWLVLVLAGLTAVLAALIMTTRISIKVRLAWSTCAQMGLMLVECALGLYEVALLHLLAHSAYKAHAFLNAGHAVCEDLQQRLAPLRSPSPATWLLALAASAALVGAAAVLSGAAAPFAIWLLFALALTVLVAERDSFDHAGSRVGALALGALLLTGYFVLKATLATTTGLPGSDPGWSTAADFWTATLVVILFASWWSLRYRPHWPVVERVSLHLFAGLYLDEWLTRLTLRLWPARLPVRANPKTLGTRARLSYPEEFAQ